MSLNLSDVPEFESQPDNICCMSSLFVKSTCVLEAKGLVTTSSTHSCSQQSLEKGGANPNFKDIYYIFKPFLQQK